MSSITPITLRRYDLWGDKAPPFTRFANNPPFTGNTPVTHTGLSLTQLQQILFNSADNNKVLQIDGDFVTVGGMIPDKMKSMWEVDGAGPLEYLKTDVELKQLERKMEETDAWEYETQSIKLTRDDLSLNTCQYLTHIILTVAMESPNIELMFNLGNIACYFKAGSNILNDNTSQKSEVNTYVLTMPYDVNLNWQDELVFKYRKTGRFLIQMKGIMVRDLLGSCTTDEDLNLKLNGPCCDYTLDTQHAIVGGEGFE